MYLILFDVDGTLISTDGAGMRAFRRAMYDVFNINIEKEAIRPDGKTDPLILKELLGYYRSLDQLSDVSQKEVFTRYLEFLEEELKLSQASGEVCVLSGVKDLLDALSSQAEFAVGLSTGNLEAGAMLKIGHAGLKDYFHFGGFSSDSEDRTMLTRIGIQRGIQYVSPASVDGVFVVGDTPFDVQHGHAAGADVIAVASGAYSVRDLGACNADLLLTDLTSVESIISFMRNRVNPG